MRTKVGWVLLALGGVALLAGAALAVVLGPDSRFATGPHAVDTDGIAVVTAPGVIRHAGVQVDLLAEVPVNKPVFVGLGNSVDVQDYVKNTQRLEVSGWSRPWSPRTREVEGRPALPGAPTALDWWIADSAGLGGASISVTLPDETVSLAVLSVGSTNLSGLELTLAYGVRGGFAKGVGLALAGVGALWAGLLLRRGDDVLQHVEDDEVEHVEVEEYVYVWIDEDGVEHEISEEEARRLQAEVEPEADPAAPVDEPAPEPDRRPRPIANVVTAADIVAGVEPPAPVEPEPVENAPVEPARAEPVVYVFVDDDGVEHVVPEDRLHEFEVVDDEEDES